MSRLEQLPLELKLHIFDAMQLTVRQNCRLQLVSKQLRADLTANQLWQRPLEGNWTLPVLGNFVIPSGMDAQAQATGGRSYFTAFGDSMRAASAARQRMSRSPCDRGPQLFSALCSQVMTRRTEYPGAFGDAHDQHGLYRVFRPPSDGRPPQFVWSPAPENSYRAHLAESMAATRPGIYPVATDTLPAYQSESTNDKSWLALLPAGVLPLAIFEGLITINELSLFPMWRRQLQSSSYVNLFGLLDILENHSQMPEAEMDVRVSQGTTMSYEESAIINASRNIRYSLERLTILKGRAEWLFQSTTDLARRMNFLDFASCLARIHPSAAPAISWFFFEDNGLSPQSVGYRRTPLKLRGLQLLLWCEVIARWPDTFGTLPSTFRSEAVLALRAVAKKNLLVQQVDWTELVKRNPSEAENVLALLPPQTRFEFLCDQIERQCATLARASGDINEYRKFILVQYRLLVADHICRVNQNRTRTGDDQNLHFLVRSYRRANRLIYCINDASFTDKEEQAWRELEAQTLPPPSWMQRVWSYFQSE